MFLTLLFVRSFSDSRMTFLNSRQKLSLILLNNHFGVKSLDAKSYNSSLCLNSIDCFEIHNAMAMPLYKSLEHSNSFKPFSNLNRFVKLFSFYSTSSNLIVSKNVFFSKFMFVRYNLIATLCLLFKHSILSKKNSKYLYFYKKCYNNLNKKIVSNEELNGLLCKNNLYFSWIVFTFIKQLNISFKLMLDTYKVYSSVSSSFGKLKHMFLIFSLLYSLQNCKTRISLFFRFYLFYKFELFLFKNPLNVFSKDLISSNPLFWSSFDFKKIFNNKILIDNNFVDFLKSWLVTNNLSYIETFGLPETHYLNYKYIINSNYSYSSFLQHLIGLLVKKGMREKAFNVFFCLSLKFLDLNSNNTSSTRFLSDSLSKVQPMFRVLKLKSRGKSKVIPQSLIASKLYSFGFTTLVKSINARGERTILLKLFSELIDISNYKGHAIKAKVSNLKLFIQNKNNVSLSGSSSQTRRRIRNKLIL